MATAKQRAWRAKFAAMYGRKKGARTRKKSKGGKMARRKGRRSGGSGGIMALLKPFAAGAIAGAIGPQIPVVNSLPALGQGAIGGYLVKRSVMGAVAGAAGAQLATPLISSVIGGSGTASKQGTW